MGINLSTKLPFATHGQKIGLLGGSFDPAHKGHIDISLYALKRLQLDFIWWLVTPQNPLKTGKAMTALEKRMDIAEHLAQHPRIKIIAPETSSNTNYSFQTIYKLLQIRPHFKFIWLIGSDNWQNFHYWKNWQQILNLIPIAVFDRPPSHHRALSNKAAARNKHFQITENKAVSLPYFPSPAWVYCHNRRNPLSSTQLRTNTKLTNA